MSNDPFKKIPPIGDEAEPVMETAREFEQERSNEPPNPEPITKGNTPRDIFRKLSKYAIPLFVIGLFVWIMLPDQRGRQLEKPDVEIDMAKQESNTNAILQELRESSEKEQKKSEDQAMTVPSAPVQALPQPQQQESTQDLEKMRREEEILGAPLETSNSIKLLTDTGPVAPQFNQTSAENEILAAKQKKEEAAIAAHNRQGQVESVADLNVPKKNMNEEFLGQYQIDGTNRPLIQQAPAANIMLSQGTVVRTALLSGVNSDMPGSISAMVTSDVYDSINGQYLLIPKGSKLVGVYNSNVAIGQERVVMAMQRLILPNGTWISLAGTPATDQIGQSGLEADVNNHFWKMFSTSFILGAASLLLPDDQNTISTSNIYGNGDVSAGSVAAIAMTETLNILLQRNRNITPTLSLDPGQEFSFMVARDMVMVPYR